jgi:hypothetical protein
MSDSLQELTGGVGSDWPLAKGHEQEGSWCKICGGSKHAHYGKDHIYQDPEPDWIHRTLTPIDEAAPAVLSFGEYEAMKKQVGGAHYKDMLIQPIEFCQKNKLNYCESNAIKYLCRHRSKGGAEDVKKAIHCLELLLEIDYPNGL